MEHEVTEMSSGLPYRNSVGLCIFNKDGLVFCAERRDKPGCWQMPQGGIRKDEDPSLAVFREMKEEVGNSKGEIIAKHPDLLRYEFPDYMQYDQKGVFNGKYRGQEQIWFAVRYLGEDADVNLTSEYEEELPEFSAWRWVDLKETVPLIVDFKRPVYASVFEKFGALGDAIKRGEDVPKWSAD